MHPYSKERLRTPSSSDSSTSLDLAYITPRLLVLSRPRIAAEAADAKQRHRDPPAAVVAHLAAAHGLANVAMLSLLEAHEPGAEWGAAGVFGLALSQPMADHAAPPAAAVRSAVAAIQRWLADSPAHVVAMHCRAGRGRSGVVAAAYLRASTGASAAAALAVVAAKRGQAVRHRAQQQVVESLSFVT